MPDDLQVQKDKALLQMAMQQELKRLAAEAEKQGKTLEQVLEEGGLENREVSFGETKITFGRPRRL